MDNNTVDIQANTIIEEAQEIDQNAMQQQPHIWSQMNAIKYHNQPHMAEVWFVGNLEKQSSLITVTPTSNQRVMFTGVWMNAQEAGCMCESVRMRERERKEAFV